MDAPEGSLLVVTEVPVELQALALRVAGHALAVATKLRVVRREQLETGSHPHTELIDDVRVTENALYVPVRSDRAQVDDAHMPLQRQVLQRFRIHTHTCSSHKCSGTISMCHSQELGRLPDTWSEGWKRLSEDWRFTEANRDHPLAARTVDDCERNALAGAMTTDQTPQLTRAIDRDTVDGHHDVTRFDTG